MLKLSKIQCFKILIIYMLLALAAVFCYNAKKLLGPSRKRPFQCSDKSLAKPFVYDTVPPLELNILGIYFPIVMILACELILYVEIQKPSKSCAWILRYVLKSFIILTLFLTGLAVERLYKNVAKIKMARLRPNFLTVCSPVNKYGSKCGSMLQPDVIDEYECTTTSYPSWAVSTAFSSFPSGHTSLVSYSMIFLICYLHLISLKLKLLHNFSTLVILIMQSLCLFVILFVGISRILDFRHHWSDIFAGFVGGSSIALVLGYYLKSQLENIEKWMKEAIEHTQEDTKTVDDGRIPRNQNVKKADCILELAIE